MKAFKNFAIALLGGAAITIISCNNKVKAVISANKTEVAVNEVVNFTNTTNADAYEWGFGDDNYSSEKSPSHSYALPGAYTVKMTACKKPGHGPARHFGGNPCKADSISIKVN